MKIQSVDFSLDAVANLGLPAIKMDRLSKIVLVAGKNGGGKTRLLTAIQRAALARKEHQSPDTSVLEAQIAETSRALKDCQDYYESEKLKEGIKSLSEKLALLRGLNLGTNDRPGREVPLVNFVPKDLNLVSPATQTLGEIRDNARDAGSGGVRSLSKSTLSYIYRLQQLDFERTHPNNSMDKTPAIGGEHYAKFNNLVVALLDEPLRRSNEGEPTLFGQSLNEHKLSSGQVVLLQLAVALHAQGKDLKNSIILLDEPENHLHSYALVEVIKKISELLTDGQIWICTHSVPLISHIAEIDPYALWNIENGNIARAGKKPQLILENLLGSKAEISKLENFLLLPHDLARSIFSAQCLLPPAVIGDLSHDPQISGINVAIGKISELGTPLRILDYGAGKGRLLTGLAELYDNKNFEELIDYYAYDSSLENRNECLSNIGKVYKNYNSRYFSSINDIARNGLSFHVAIFSNVLHEISPKFWGEIFLKEMSALISKSGWLMLVEDHRMPIGEMAHEFGFLVLDTEELKILFNIGHDDERNELFFCVEERGDGRLKAHMIHSSLIIRFSEECLKSAITRLKDRSIFELKKIRSKNYNKNYESGQIYGFWSQLLSNSILYLNTHNL